MLEVVEILLQVTGFVIESFVGQIFSLNTFDNLLPDVGFTILASLVLSHDLLSTKEFAVGLILPHIEFVSDLASWDLSGSKTLWEAFLLEFVEGTADLFSFWFLWLDWDGVVVLAPLVALESPPLATFVLEDVAIVMPVSIMPGPSFLGETVFGWSPVMPVTIVVSVPDFLSWVPLPEDLWLLGLLAPVAHGSVALVLLNKVQALGLSVKNVLILGVNSSFVFTIMLPVVTFNVFIGPLLRSISFSFSLLLEAFIIGINIFPFGGS